MNKFLKLLLILAITPIILATAGFIVLPASVLAFIKNGKEVFIGSYMIYTFAIINVVLSFFGITYLKRVKKNHIIITALAIMIAAAGYINYAGDLDNIIKVKDKEKAAAVAADNVSTDSNEAEAADTDFTDEPGTVILTSAGVKSEAVAAAKLNREQVRASSIENLKSIADDAGIAEDAKKAAVEQLAKLENNADKETAIELLLSAKGFDSSVVTVSDTNVDAVINVSELSDTDKAQIEDIIKRKTGFAADKITINICNN